MTVPSGKRLPFSEPSITTAQKKTRFVMVVVAATDERLLGLDPSPLDKGIVFRGEVLRAINGEQKVV